MVDLAKAPFPGASVPLTADDFGAAFVVTSEMLSGYVIEGKIRLTNQGNESGITMIQPDKGVRPRPPSPLPVEESLVPRLTPQEMACIAERTFRQAEMKRLIEADGGFVCLGCALREGTHRGDTLCGTCWSVMHASLRPEIVDRDGKPLLPAPREPWSPSVSDADCLGVDV